MLFTATDLISSTSVSLPFELEFTDNPCIGSWTNVPADNELDASTVQFDNNPLLIPFVGMHHGQCEFEVLVKVNVNGV